MRFASHEEAVGLLADFAEDDEEDCVSFGVANRETVGVQGNWSLSERLQNLRVRQQKVMA